MPSFPADIVKEIAPTGRLRAAINYGNTVISPRDPKTGEIIGVTAQLSKELGRQLNLPVDILPYARPVEIFDCVKQDIWDICFLAIEPARAAEIAFTAPYVIIEGTYMVTEQSPLREVDDVDRAGIKISVGEGSAYDLYLTRALKQATLVRFKGGAAAFEGFRKGLDAMAGVRQPLVKQAAETPGLRVMKGRFTDIQQAMGTKPDRMKSLPYLKSFIEEMKASGFVAKGLKNSGQEATVAPPAK